MSKKSATISSKSVASLARGARQVQGPTPALAAGPCIASDPQSAGQQEDGLARMAMFAENLDRLYNDFKGQRWPAGASFLCSLLAYLRSAGDGWHEAAGQLRQHPLFEHLLRDPCTSRAYLRRRSPGGQGELVEMLMAYQPVGEGPANSRDFFSRALSASFGEAFRHRQTLGRKVLSEAVAEGRSVCALYCGYLGEAAALAGQSLGSFVAVDDDARALSRIGQLHGDSIELIRSSPRDWLDRAGAEGRRFDLVYAPSLSDRLDDGALRETMARIAQLLTAGGRVMIGALNEHSLSGYLEAAMDWFLVYRNRDKLACLAEDAGLTYRQFGESGGLAHFCEGWLSGGAQVS